MHPNNGFIVLHTMRGVQVYVHTATIIAVHGDGAPGGGSTVYTAVRDVVFHVCEGAAEVIAKFDMGQGDFSGAAS